MRVVAVSRTACALFLASGVLRAVAQTSDGAPVPVAAQTVAVSDAAAAPVAAAPVAPVAAEPVAPVAAEPAAEPVTAAEPVAPVAAPTDAAPAAAAATPAVAEEAEKEPSTAAPAAEEEVKTPATSAPQVTAVPPVVPTTPAAPKANCPEVPSGSFPDAAMLRDMTCIDPATVSGAPTPAGNIALTGLANISAKGVQCIQGEYETKTMILPGSSTLTLGASTCSLKTVGYSKIQGVWDKASMRLDYENCSSGPPTATLMMDIEKVKDFDAPPSAFPFLKEVCEKVTTTPSATSGKVSYTFSQNTVGLNKCKGKILNSYAGLDAESCKTACIAILSRFSATGMSVTNNAEVCLGYASNPTLTLGEDNCHLYGENVPVNQIESNDETGWTCYNLTAEAHEMKETTVAPPTAEELAAADAALPRLNVDPSKEAVTGSVLTYSNSADQCYQPFNVIVLQDNTFKAVSAKVKESEWEEFLKFVPEPPESKERRLKDKKDQASTPVAEVFADRVAYAGAQNLLAPGVGLTPLGAGVTAVPGAGVAPGITPITPAPLEEVVTTTPPCRPVPPAESPVATIWTVILGILVLPCGYGGYMIGSRKSSSAQYQPLSSQ